MKGYYCLIPHLFQSLKENWNLNQSGGLLGYGDTSLGVVVVKNPWVLERMCTSTSQGTRTRFCIFLIIDWLLLDLQFNCLFYIIHFYIKGIHRSNNNLLRFIILQVRHICDVSNWYTMLPEVQCCAQCTKEGRRGEGLLVGMGSCFPMSTQ